MAFLNILPNETEIVGRWFVEGGSTTADEAANRIDALINNYLIRIGTSQDGWSVLYRDPGDGRYWQLTYPDSGAQGGGAPRLQVVLEQDLPAPHS